MCKTCVNSHVIRTSSGVVTISLPRHLSPHSSVAAARAAGAFDRLRRPRWLSLSKPPLYVVLLRYHPSGVNDLSATSGNTARCRSRHFNRTFLISIQLPRPSATPSFQEGELGLRLSVAACVGAQVTILLYLCRLVRIESL